jgi:hypothetical protein
MGSVVTLAGFVQCGNTAGGTGSPTEDASTPGDASTLEEASTSDEDTSRSDGGEADGALPQDGWSNAQEPGDGQTDAAQDAWADAAATDAPVILTLDSGLLWDGACASDLQTGFVSGTEICASLPSTFNANDTLACLPANGDGGECYLVDPAGREYEWLICRTWAAGDGPEILGDGEHIPIGPLICGNPGFPNVLPGLCCGALSQGPNLGDAGYVVFGRVIDTDGDGIPNIIDNGPTVLNIDQTDEDRDGVGDVCDDCPYTYNPDQASMTDGGAGNACNCALANVRLGPNGCPCSDGGAGASSDAGDVCHWLGTADGGVVDGG